LVVNEREAGQVRTIFETYVEKGSVIETVRELDRRGWTTKQWTTKKGKQLGGRPFDRNGLYNLLTNVIYLGKVRHLDEMYAGEHTALVDAGLFENVQACLRRNYSRGGSQNRNRYGALLKGLLRCTPCGRVMMHTYSVRHKNRYRYYVCGQAQKRGWHTCPSKSVPADEIERFVVGQIRKLGPDCLEPAMTGLSQVEFPAVDESALDVFDRVWEALATQEKARVVQRLIERVDYDGAEGTVSVVFRSNGTATEEAEQETEETEVA
jgi:hypothetical protein